MVRLVVQMRVGLGALADGKMKPSGAINGLHRSADNFQGHFIFAQTIVSSTGTASPHWPLSGLLMSVICERHYIFCALSLTDVRAP